MATTTHERTEVRERPAGAPLAPGTDGSDGPVTMGERWRRVGILLVAVLVGLPTGAVVHRLSGELEVDRGFWTTVGVGVVGTAVVTFCFPRWRRFPIRASRPGEWPRTPVQKAMAVVLLVVLYVAAVTVCYFRLAG